MKEPEQISEYAWFDPEDGVVSFLLTDNMTYNIGIEEFLIFFDKIDEIKKGLLNSNSIIIGTSTDPEGVQSEHLMLKPDDEDYN